MQMTITESSAVLIKEFPLEEHVDDLILSNILSFSGEVMTFFCCFVSKKWKKLVKGLLSCGLLKTFAFSKLYVMCARDGYMKLLRLTKELEVKSAPAGHQIRLDSNVTYYAGHHGNMKMLKWAWENGSPWSVNTCYEISERGSLEMLKFARENGAPWTAMTPSHAAGRGNLEMVRWARENGCDWDSRVLTAAGRSGSLEIIKYGLANGLEWCYSVFATAFKSGHAEIIQWGLDNGFHADDELLQYANFQEGPAGLDMLKWARGLGCQWGNFAMHAGHLNRLDLLTYAIRNGCEIPPKFCEELYRAKKIHVLRWARQNGCRCADDSVFHTLKCPNVPCTCT